MTTPESTPAQRGHSLPPLALIAIRVLLTLIIGGGGIWLGMGLGQPKVAPLSSPAVITDEPVEQAAITAEPVAATPTPDAPLGNDALAEKFGSSVFLAESEGCNTGGSGTAWVIDEHHLVTNWHVVSIDPEPTIVSRDGKDRFQGTVIGGTSEPDVAVIHVEEKLPEPLAWASTEKLREGQEIVSLGYPAPKGDFAVTPSTIISFQMDGSTREAIRGDGALDYGNSGGPALTKDGEVAGVATVMVKEANQLQMVPLLFTADALESTVSDMIANPKTVEPECDPVFASMPSDWWDDFEGFESDGPQSYGDDAGLDRLYDSCAAGDLEACDDLWRSSPWGSEYDSFANTCGGTTSGSYGMCALEQQWEEEARAYEAEVERQEAEAEREAAEQQAAEEREAAAEQAALDALVNSCEGGDMQACDDLSWEADYGSAEYAVSDTCGGHFPDGWGSCVDRESQAAELESLVGLCQSGDMQACDDLWYAADTSTPAHGVAEDCGGYYPGEGGMCTWARDDDNG